GCYRSAVTVKRIFNCLLTTVYPIVERLVAEKLLKCPVGTAIFFFQTGSAEAPPTHQRNVYCNRVELDKSPKCSSKTEPIITAAGSLYSSSNRIFGHF